MSLDFADDITNFGVHKIYPYPARFPPQLPRHFIEKYDPTVVLDCFGGSGTTVVEAKLHGAHGIHMDLMPISLMCARVKTHEFSYHEFHRGEVEMEKQLEHPEIGPLPPKVAEQVGWNGNDEFFFQRTVLEQVQAVRLGISKMVTDEYIKDFFSLCAAACLRRCSKARPGELDWSPSREERHETDFIGIFRQKYRAEATNFIDFVRDNKSFHNGKKTTIINTKEGWLKESVDLIVTSPPYGKLSKVINYPDIHKFSHAFFSRGPRPSPADFIQTTAQLSLYFQKVTAFLKQGGHCVVVVAPSSSDNWVLETRGILKDCGLEKEEEIERVIDPKKKTIPGAIKTEWVLDWVKN